MSIGAFSSAATLSASADQTQSIAFGKVRYLQERSEQPHEHLQERKSTSRFLAGVTVITKRADWLQAAYKRLAQLGRLKANWDGYEAESPKPVAIDTARNALAELAEIDLPPSVDPSVEGGICISFRKGLKYADIECFNSGVILAAVSRGKGDSRVWRISEDDISQASRTIRTFLMGKAE